MSGDTSKGKWREIWTIIFFAISFFLLVSLISFDIRDCPWMYYPPQVPLKNWTGAFGAYTSGGLIYLFGLGSYILVAIFGTLGWNIFKEKKITRSNATGIVLLLLVSCAFMDILPFNLLDKLGNYNGGLFGHFFTYFLDRYFGKLGSYIIIGTLFVLSLLLSTEFSFTNLKREKKKEEMKGILDEKEIFPRVGPVIIGAKERKKPVQPHFDFINELYEPPPLDLLTEPVGPEEVPKEQLLEDARILEETLSNFGVSVKITQISRGPVITRFEIQPAAGVRVSSIMNLSNDLALGLAVPSVRIEIPVPGKAVMGIEVPNKTPNIVYLREMLESEPFRQSKKPLTFSLGKDIGGNPIVSDLEGMPHLLIAGATGSGKSAFIHSLILSFLFRNGPSDINFILIDPKMVELIVFEGIPHLVLPVMKEAKKSGFAMKWLIKEMEDRYQSFLGKGVHTIRDYNQTTPKLPYLVVIIDELADLMLLSPLEIEDKLCRLAQMGRAVGIHLVLATQRPSVDIITGLIKANFPSRISFAVSTQVDSRTILDFAGAEKLLGKGDMLFSQIGALKPVRLQGAFAFHQEVKKVVAYLKDKYGSSEYDNEILEIEKEVPIEGEDELFKEAVQLVIRHRQASTSLLQRRLKIGYNRAARIVDTMYERGIIGPSDGSKPRDVLVDENYLKKL
ncbi:hypothetical protein AUJ66_00740 [Candidatus Desantisbacteria bacterium CG1_02_38_46]|uniref:Cell division protein FtsK n=3 Tax=unclassified Candidatus Desantisiibacteriota TaxID=3106372 RepID=A0A2H9PDA6_9BACT|nr:MAG: hypothetical protein AUJ66_00740 [Candidatus Desantisbacteria bacterium CG1_02_38_46]PIU51065.1 MAG: cell division protein FtsK [Candidatus Desantisbacteria bacterium CG07_land_8_20_14_0_80_39_15]PIZ16607.1 MAG: cell division protein FtsK [Candidatus Desantisbacteria bacterium CG_4_10_14_0_8_um_filter_39_17]